jgi:hypothetical protein
MGSSLDIGGFLNIRWVYIIILRDFSFKQFSKISSWEYIYIK